MIQIQKFCLVIESQILFSWYLYTFSFPTKWRSTESHNRDSKSSLIELHTQTSLSVFFACKGFSFQTIHAAKVAIKNPWPRSPNMTANKNGNEMMVYGAESLKIRIRINSIEISFKVKFSYTLVVFNQYQS